jgi:hypothetical protein
VTGKRLLLFLGAFLFSAAASYGIILVRRGEVRVDLPDPTHVVVYPPPPPPTPPAPPPPPSVPVAESTPERKMFDKAIEYIQSTQEPDGHWSATKSGAATEYSSINGDITITALCISALLDTNQGRNQNRDAIKCVKRGMDWLTKQIADDGHIGDENGGEPVVAQIFASFAFLQAIEMSNKASMQETSGKLCRYTMSKLAAKSGGYGERKDAAHARADVTALATVLFNQARSIYITFAEPVTDDNGKNHAAALAIEKTIKLGIESLRCDPRKSGAFARSGDAMKPDWNATIAGLLNQKALGMEAPEYVAGLEYVFGVKYDEFRLTKSETFPTLEENLKWGTKGEGFEALTVFQGSMLFFNEYGPARAEWATWCKNVLSMLLKHQSSDGSWAADGADARRGRLWRTALLARVINVLSPPQLPPPPPQAPAPEEKAPEEK